MGFFPIDRDLFTSSIWLTGSPEMRCLWMWLLGNRSDDGVVRHRDIAIAYGAVLTLEKTKELLQKLSGPDAESRTPTNDGRRIERAEGGFWRIINHELYYSKDYSTPRWRTWRDRKKGLKGSTNVGSVGQTFESLASTKDKDKDKDNSVGSSPLFPVQSSILGDPPFPSGADAPGAVAPVVAVEVAKVNWPREAGELWKSAFKGSANFKEIGNHLKPLVDVHGWPLVREAWRSYLEMTPEDYASANDFATRKFGKLAGLRAGSPPRDDVTAHNERVLADFARKNQLGDLVRPMPAVQRKLGG